MIYPYLFYAAATIDDIVTNNLPNSSGDDPANNQVANALEIVFGVMGALAVLMIVIAGLRYMLAGGDPSKVANARNTIIYSVIGLVVALTAYSIVYFVVRNV